MKARNAAIRCQRAFCAFHSIRRTPVHSTATLVPSTDLEGSATARLHAAEAEIARLRDALAVARDEQRRCVERTDLFLNVLAGELRNPLAPMTHALQILRQRG